MAYRKLEVNDAVRITGYSAYSGKYHGQDGTVLEALDHAAKVGFHDEGKSKELWFYNRNLVVTRDSPDYVAPAKQTTPKLTKEIKMSTFKIGDKVRVTGSRLFASYTLGFEGEIYKIEDNVVYLRFPDGDTDYGYDSEIELINVPVVEAHKTLADKLDALDALTAEIRAMVGL